MFEKHAITLKNPITVLHNPGFSAGMLSYMKPIELKIASLAEAGVKKDGDNPAFDLAAEVRDHPDSLYVTSFAIKANETNDNGDWFSTDELKKATATFVGVPVFTNHQNTDIEKAKGKVVHSWYDNEKDGIFVVMRIDAVAYPHLARGIKEDYVVGCFPPDAKVLMSDGTEKTIFDVSVGDQVISGKGNICEILAKRIKCHKGKLLSLKVEGIKEPVVLTTYHNVVVYKMQDHCCCGCDKELLERKDKRITQQFFGRKFKQGHNARGQDASFAHDYIQKAPATELNVGDFLVEPKLNNQYEQRLIKTIDEAFLVGLFLAEGSYEKRKGIRHSALFNFGANEFETIADDCYNKLCNVFSNHRNKPTILWRPEGSQTRVCLYGKDVADWFYLRCGEYSSQKKLHPDLLNCSTELTLAILAGYIEGDGCCYRNQYTMATISKDLADQLRVLFGKVGIRTSYTKTKAATPNRKDPHVICCGNTTSNELSKYLVWKKLPKSIHKFAKWHNLAEYHLRRIKSIKEIEYTGPVYDLEIKDDHTYCVNHLAMSNTSMGTSVEYSLCSACHNFAAKPTEYCSCIKEQRRKKVSGNIQCHYHDHGEAVECPLCGCKKGEKKVNLVKDQEIHEKNYNLRFIEQSLVVNPACHECGITEIIDTSKFLKKVAQLKESLPGLLKAASVHPVACTDQSCVSIINEEDKVVFENALQHVGGIADRIREINAFEQLQKQAVQAADHLTGLTKVAGEKELQDLKTALDLVSDVCKKMIDQKAQVDLEYLQELTEVMTQLQETVSELEQMGYSRLLSPEEGTNYIGTTENPAPPPGGTAAPLPSPVGGNPATGGSKIETGPAAGGVGTITGPMARSKKHVKLGLSLPTHKKKQVQFKSNFKKMSSVKLWKTAAVKMPSSIRKKINDRIYAITKNYHPEIPLSDIDQSLREHGFLLIQEDGTPWSGFLTGKEGRATIDVGLLSQSKDGMYAEVENTQLVITWYKLTNQWETVAYLS